MADGVVQLVVSLGSTTELPEDTVQNVLNCGLTGVLAPGDVSTAMAAVRDFFNALAPGQTTDIANRINGSISRVANACTIEAYATLDLTGATPLGSPIDTLSFTMDPEGSSNDLPEEVAVVVSYNADLTNVPVTESNPSPPPATIRPQQRRRGRMFVGPLNQLAGTTSGTPNLFRPFSGFRVDLGAAFAGMATTINGTGGLELGIWSKADAEVFTAVGGYVDDAWDTQRRRGVAPTVRTSFSI